MNADMNCQALAQGAAKTTSDQRSGAEALHAVPVIFLKCDEEIPPRSQVRDTCTVCNAWAVPALRGTAEIAICAEGVKYGISGLPLTPSAAAASVAAARGPAAVINLSLIHI